MIFFGVPICLIESLSVFDIFITMLLICSLKVIIFSSIFVIELFESFCPIQMLPCGIFLSMMIISIDKIIVVLSILHLFSHSFILFFKWLFHSLRPMFSLFPILVRFLIRKFSSRWISEDKLIVSSSFIYISKYRISLCYFFEKILKLLTEILYLLFVFIVIFYSIRMVLFCCKKFNIDIIPKS